MSAESPARRRPQEGLRVRPQSVSDKTILESVAGFINEVVPQGYMTGQLVDGKDAILWARFETMDANDPHLLGEVGVGGPPLLLVLGYAVGVQVWLVPSSGEATEVLAWRQGVVRTLRLLPSPEPRLPHEGHLAKKRPLVALCDSAGSGPQFSSVSFVSLKDGEQVKSIKFKHAVNDILVSRVCIAVTFPERVAVFDAARLEESFSVTTCFSSPGLNPNPVALGARWLAFADRRLLPSVRSSGGVELEGVPSYTATVLQAAKTLGKGIREVASSLTGQKVAQAAPAPDASTPGVVTVLDVAKGGQDPEEAVVAHFVAHAAPIVHLAFDPSGSLLLTADKHGHDFHVFQLHPHPCGSSLGAVHHLYVLHRGDTTAKVQDAIFSTDSRYCAVSTLRGTTHVFAVNPYGGNPSMRTHGSSVVVNRLSRFHRSAGLDDPLPCPNPRLPPYPRPTVLFPLVQLRQPLAASAANPAIQSSQRPGLGRTSSDDGLPLRVAATFAGPRAWLAGPGGLLGREREKRRPAEALFVAACHGNLIEYHLEPRPLPGKEKIGDEASIELAVAAKAQWALLRQPGSHEIQPPLNSDNPLLFSGNLNKTARQNKENNDTWLSQVEIVTHAGPHRRLWMGPQFTFKMYTTTKGPNGTIERETMDVGTSGRPARSHPVNMPSSGIVPVLIESGSCNSYDQSPRLMDMYGETEGEGVAGESQLREDLADAMLESPAGAPIKDPGRQSAGRCPSVEELMPRVLITVAATLQSPDANRAPSPAVEEEQFEEALPGRESPPLEELEEVQILAEPFEEVEEPPFEEPVKVDLLPAEPFEEVPSIMEEAPPTVEVIAELPDENQEPPRGILNNNSNKSKGKKAKKKKK
ncbi:breast carcinoma-amplified sequence 3 homolog isoform X2 [Neocloeon triangulifer]|nr:breast carcinoma-amplified sequence 3 homolog isoform X2 [Neocloeon triangulifer]